MMVAEPGPAEQAERHDGMAECMRKMSNQPSVLSVEERKSAVGDKSTVGSRSAAWRFITSVDYKEKINGNKRQAVTRGSTPSQWKLNSRKPVTASSR